MEAPPAFQFYPGDWRRHPGVQALDLEHKGAWIECLAMMHFSPDRGRLLYPSGVPMDDEAIARNLSVSEARWKQIRSKLVATGVAKEDGSGALVSGRMVKDEGIRRVRAEAGRKGGIVSKPQAKQKQDQPLSSSSSSSKQKHLDDFDELWDRYPKRTGSNPKRKALSAWNARMAEGVDPSDILDGLERYVKYLENQSKVGTPFVLQASTFIGPDRRWEEEWAVPGQNGTDQWADFRAAYTYDPDGG